MDRELYLQQIKDFGYHPTQISYDMLYHYYMRADKHLSLTIQQFTEAFSSWLIIQRPDFMLRLGEIVRAFYNKLHRIIYVSVNGGVISAY